MIRANLLLKSFYKFKMNRSFWDRLNGLLLALGIVMVLLPACNQPAIEQKPAKVELKKNEQQQYRLFVNDKEFFVKGAGLEFGKIDALAANGANSFRTWRTENGKQDALEVLDAAQKKGLMVMMGLEVARERHGFDYNDTAKVLEQFNYLKKEVLRLKDHPALLAWAIGNELNLGAENLKVYDAVNEISLMIHQLDGNHPTTTTMAGIGKREVDYIKENCTDIDFISIQMYGDIVNLQQRIAEAGWEGPYMVTEWGATGHWEVGKTSWDIPVEQTSQEKAKAFINRYDLAIESDKQNCLGSYVFLWGQKQERTPTWYGMFLENGAKTETVDAMHYIWTGKWPDDRCPSLEAFTINGLSAFDNVKVSKNQALNAEVKVRNYENDSLTYIWEILPESTDLGWGGDFETRPETQFIKESDSVETIPAPEISGAYRLFVYVVDNAGNAATANIPFFVEE
ncbi:MAG: glycoside hydrolase family 2 TIM barrel-domain containing protein [Salinivirgaceae bacterium]